MFNKKALLALSMMPCLVFGDFKVSQIGNEVTVLSEVNLPLDAQKYPAIFFLTDDKGTTRYQLVVSTADEEESGVLIQMSLFELGENKKNLISSPVVRLPWEEQEELYISDEDGTEWIYNFKADSTHKSIKVSELSENEYIINEWNLDLNESEFPRSFILNDSANKTQYQVVVLSVHAEDKENILIQSNVFKIKNDKKLLIASPVIRTQWNEEAMIIVTDESGKEWGYSFIAEKTETLD